VLGANHTIGAGKILAGVGTKTTDGLSKVKQMTLGYEYSLSKRTYIYADVSTKKGAPISAANPKNNMKHIDLGINHSF